MQKIKYLGAASTTVVLIACGAAEVSPQLADARSTYHRIENSEIARVNPSGLHVASEALQRAEAAHEEDPASVKEQHFAYLAHRQALLAEARGHKAIAMENKTDARADYTQRLESRAESEAAAREKAQHKLGETSEALQSTKSELEKERKAREKAEREAALAMDSLRELSMVRQEKKDVVITLSGSVLFKTGSSSLLGAAQTRLNQVADALDGYRDKDILVVGHTGSRGSDSSNQELSLARAQSVRT
ncbi:MAG: OmpA family protein, partial [Myxococcales bacterium]|nr:OmpA family protein [Myxococcales bacterium]